MPEISYQKPKEKKYPIVEPVPGTIPVSAANNATIEYLTNAIEYMESIVSEDPSMEPFILPTIKSFRQTREFTILNYKKLASSNKSDLDQYEKAIQDYERLINKQKMGEDEIQIFLEENPIIIDRGLKKLIPKKTFGGEGIPDFVAVLRNGNYILIEIEKPTDKLYTKKGDPTAEFSHAEQQVLDYLRWANENKEFLRKRDLPSISAENTRGLLIIGMNKNLGPEEKEKLKMRNFSSRSTHEVKTFDDILTENQQVIENLRKHVKK